MIIPNSSVLYKRQPAVVTETEDDKFVIKYQTARAESSGRSAEYAVQKVREKDIALLHEGPVSSPEKLTGSSDPDLEKQISELHALLVSDPATAAEPVSLSDAAELMRGSFSADESWMIFRALSESAEFALDEAALKNGAVRFLPRSEADAAAVLQKRGEKERGEEERGEFIQRLKKRSLNLPDDAKYMADVEALALGRTGRSRTLAEASVAQTPEKAHSLLLETGIWDITRNPYPSRFGLSSVSAKEGLPSPPPEERLRVAGVSYAIDNAWSADPDDAVAWDGEYLWVHVADPASAVMPDNSADRTARRRGATLYLPEGAVRMLCEDSLSDYALGLNEESRALSFRLTLDENCAVTDCRIFKTAVTVRRLTYEEADRRKDSAELAPLFAVARKNAARREKAGAMQINMPEAHITVEKETGKVSVRPLVHYESDAMVCEMMLLAGEGAARFAFQNGIPFPYISQEPPEIPASVPEGLAGQFRLLKCMHKRSVGITPAPHAGIGVTMYSQVTSPLRRYSDLIAHEQLRAFLDGRPLIDKDTMLERIAEGDAASVAAKKAARMSETHWKLVYLLQNPGWQGEAVCIDRRGNDCLVLVTQLAMQTVMKNRPDLDLNGVIKVRAAKISIPEQTAVFVPA